MESNLHYHYHPNSDDSKEYHAGLEHEDLTMLEDNVTEMQR